MNLTTSKLLFALLLIVPSLVGGCARDRVKPQEAPPEQRWASCSQCGTVEAITQRLLSSGPNAYYVYDLHVRMEKTQLLRVIPVPIRGALDVGDRVRVMGGTVQPEMAPASAPDSKPEA